MPQQPLDFNPSTGDDTTGAMRKLDNNIKDHESRLSTLGNAASLNVGTTAGTVAAGNDARIVGAAQQGSVLPKANPIYTGTLSKVGVQGENCYAVTSPVGAVGIGGNYGDWTGARSPALQIDAMLPTAAYMVARAAQWGSRVLWGMDVYAGGSTSSLVALSFHFDQGLNRHVFFGDGSAAFAKALTQNSDYRIKDNVVRLDPADVADRLRKVQPIEYLDNRTPEDHRRLPGNLAHELQEQFPLVVIGEKDATQLEEVLVGDTTPYRPGEEPPDWVPPHKEMRKVPVLQNVNYIGMVPYLQAAWQDSDSRIGELEQALADLRAELAALKAP